MADSANSRARILASIRMSLGEASAREAIAAEYSALPRAYQRSSTPGGQAVLDLFSERLLEYDAGVYRAIETDIASAVAGILTARAKATLAVPEGLPPAWLPKGFDFAIADAWDNCQLDAIQGALSSCTVAIAETGTIVLQNAPAQGPRILSLVPDYHLCVVFDDQVAATVPEAFDRLLATSHLPTTFISGPSATADIEMTRIKGVHGPRNLDVLLVSRLMREEQ